MSSAQQNTPLVQMANSFYHCPCCDQFHNCFIQLTAHVKCNTQETITINSAEITKLLHICFQIGFSFCLNYVATSAMFDSYQETPWSLWQEGCMICLLTHWNTNFLTLQCGAFKSQFRRKWQFCTFVFYACKLIFIDFNTYSCCAVMLGWSLKCLFTSFFVV